MTDDHAPNPLKDVRAGLYAVGCIQEIHADLAGADISGTRELQPTSVDWLAGRLGER